MDIPLARSDYFRGVAKEARIRVRNRYFEQNPVLTETQTALLARMGTRRGVYLGPGPIQGAYSQPGSFSDAEFIASGQQLWRVDVDLTTTLIGDIPSISEKSAVSMAATANIGTTPAFLFVAAGSSLMCYIENGFATGAITGVPVNNNVVLVDLYYYKFTNGSVDAGTPDGTAGNPWLVALGASTSAAWQNLGDAFGATGIPGTQYSTDLVINDAITVRQISDDTVVIWASQPGIIGNSVTTTETGGGIAWGAGFLVGGGDPTFFQVPTPDDVGILSVGYSASYVVCVPVQGQDINGRFYYIDPGETTIDPVNFATAERAPDPISGVVVFGDQFWLPGVKTTEPWYFSGNPDTPVLRMQGVVFDRGSWEGTAVQVKDCMIIVDSEGAVFKVKDGLQRISRPDIEEQIREAIQYQASQTL